MRTKILNKGLPEGYSEAADLVTGITSEVSDLYDKAEKRLEPAVKSMKMATKSIIPKAEGILPKTVYDKVNTWANSDSSSGSVSVDADEETISAAIGNIFTVQAEQAEQGRQEESVKVAFKNEVDTIRHAERGDQLMAIQQSMARLVGYQDNITAEYQKKSLDLQFRHYFAARDLLKISAASNADIITALNDIKTNTGLPDWVKTEQTENFSAMLNERLMGGTVDTVAGYMSNFRSNLISNIKDNAMDKIGGVADGINDAMDMVSTVSELSSDEDMGANPIEMGGDIAGGIGTNKFMDWLLPKIKEGDNMPTALVTAGLRARNATRGFDSYLKENIDNADNLTGPSGALFRFLAENAPTMKTNETVLNNLVTDATKQVQWDVLSRRTLIEVIPEYLARITQNTETLATGSPAEKMVFSARSEQFITETQANKETTNALLKRANVQGYKDTSNSALDQLFDGADVSAEARKAMAEQMYSDIRKGYQFNPKRYFTMDGFESYLEPAVIQELIGFFRDRFKAVDVGDGVEEEWVSTGKDGVLNLTESLRVKTKRLQSDLPDIQTTLRESLSVGDKERLRAAGWIEKNGNVDQFNDGLLREMLTGELDINEPDIAEMSPVQSSASNRLSAMMSNGDDTSSTSDEYYPHVDMASSVIPMVIPGTVPNEREYAHVEAPKTNAVRDDHNDHLQELINLQTESNTHAVAKMGTLNEIKELIEAQAVMMSGDPNNQVAKEVLEQLIGIRDRGMSGAPSQVSSLKSGFLNLGKSIFSGISGGISGIGAIGSSIISKATSLVGSGIDAVTNKKEQLDVFLAGMRTPVLKAELMKTGRYIDEATGNVIAKLSDITGPVKDISTNTYVITAQDFADGLYEENGESLLSKLGSGAQSLLLGGVGAVSAYYGGLGKLANTTFTFLRDKLVTAATDITDIYVKGRFDEGAILLKSKLLAGKYFDAAGNVITDLKDIAGGVFDEDGNTVLSTEDIDAGLVNVKGEGITLSGIISKGGSLLSNATSLAVAGGKKGWDLLKGYYAGIGNIAGGILGRLRGVAAEGDNGPLDIDSIDITTNSVYINAATVNSTKSVNDTVVSGTGTTKDTVRKMGENIVSQVENVRDRVASSGLRDVIDVAIQDGVDKASDLGQAVKKAVDSTEFKESLQDGINVATDSVSNAATNAIDRLTEASGRGMDAVQTTLKDSATLTNLSAATQNVGNTLSDDLTSATEKARGIYDTVIGEDASVVDSVDGNTVVETPTGDVGVGDGSIKGYLASLVALTKAGISGDQLRVGGWRERLFGGSDNDDSDAPRQGIGARIKSKAGGLLGAIGLGAAASAGSDDDGDGGFGVGDALLTGATSGVAESVLDRVGGNNDSSGDTNRSTNARGRSRGVFRRILDGANEIRRGGIRGNIGKLIAAGSSVASKGIGGNLKSLSKGINAVGRGVKSVGRSISGKALTSSGIKKLLLWGLGGAAAVTGGVLAAPAIGVALAAAGAAYTAYETYGFFKDRWGAEPIEAYRFAQYGLNPNDLSHRNLLRKMESVVIDKVVYRSGDGNNVLSGVSIDDLSDFMEVVGIDYEADVDEDPENAQRIVSFIDWYRNRFVPVFLLHHGIANLINNKVDLLDIDDELDDDLKYRFVKDAYYPDDDSGKTPYSVTASPVEEYEVPGGYAEVDAIRDRLMDKYEDDSVEEKDKEEALGASAVAPVTVGGVAGRRKRRSKVNPTPINTETTPSPIPVTNKRKSRVAKYRTKNMMPVAIAATALSTSVAAATLPTEPTITEPTPPSADVVTSSLPTIAKSLKGAIVKSGVPDSEFIVPVDGDVLTTFNKKGGVTFSADAKAEVVASSDGVVIGTKTDSSKGKLLYVKNDNGTTSIYSYLSKYAGGITYGTRVLQGSRLGEVDKVGDATRPQLGMEIRTDSYKASTAIDPLSVLDSSRGMQVVKRAQITMRAVDTPSIPQEPKVTTDERLATAIQRNAPLVDAPKVQPTIFDNVPDVETPRSILPPPPVEKVKLEGPDPIIVETLKQNRAEIQQASYLATSVSDSEMTNKILYESLEVQLRMEMHLAKISMNTEETKEATHYLAKGAMEEDVYIPKRRKPKPAQVTGGDLAKAFSGKEGKVKTPPPMTVKRNT